MARLVGVLHTSHGPMTTLPAEKWSAYGANRTFRSDVVRETDEEAAAKANRAKAGVSILKAKLEELRPDVLVIFGDDQKEGFDFSNFPALMVYVGEDFAGGAYGQRGKPELYTTTPGHPGLAVHILTTLLSNGFDPAFSMSVPKPDEGMCHAVMRPLEYFDAYAIPTVPILFNGYYPPQSPAKRHYEIGRTVRVAIDAYPEDLRVLAIGSGGMWHTPGRPDSYIDEDFDRSLLVDLEKGDVAMMAEHFDAYKIPADDLSQDIGPGSRGMTGMPAISGPQLGTRETCNWIGAAAVADGCPNVIVDYIPMYASPIGTAFAYCDNV